MAIVLRLGSRSKGNHPSCHIVFFSTSNSNSNSHSNSNSPFSSLFSEIKGKLKESSPSPSNTKRSPNFNDEISKNLHEFRARTTAPPPPQQQISFQKIYQENMNRNPPNSSSFNFNSIRGSLQNIKSAAQTTPTWSHPMPSTTSGSFLGKEVSRDGSPASPSSSLSFLRTYSMKDLGEKLRMLRPEGMRKDWFSVRELSERLGRLRKMEEEEEEKQAHSNTQYGFNKIVFDHVRGSLAQLDKNQTEAAKKASRQGLSILSQLNGTPTFSLGPPKPDLLEKYFHPDNMSSSEKLKIELAKVRDDFKMSDSDCGSSRVQIAQLTTKIKHLSAVLHKKDVHSRKGLLAMVQRRKRLLKYLRRTDWDSYCFVISKLGLRDNPDHIYRTRSVMAT